MEKRVIGVFDSGVGGLTSLKHLLNKTDSTIIYFGDTDRVPYGQKSRDEILRMAEQNYRFLRSLNVDTILIACGTVCSNAYEHLLDISDIPIFEIITPTCKRAIEKTKNGRIMVLGTLATINSHSYAKRIKSLNHDISILEVACPDFVPLIEHGYIRDENIVTLNAVKKYLEPIKSFAPDCVILGCTHYPLISTFIQNEFSSASIIDSGKEGALNLLCSNNIISSNCMDNACNVHFYVSGASSQFMEIADIFLGMELHDFDISHVNIEQF